MICGISYIKKGGESELQRDSLKLMIHQVNDDRIRLISRNARRSSDWEESIQIIVKIIE
jgi:hypothetical protein